MLASSTIQVKQTHGVACVTVSCAPLSVPVDTTNNRSFLLLNTVQTSNRRFGPRAWTRTSLQRSRMRVTDQRGRPFGSRNFGHTWIPRCRSRWPRSLKNRRYGKLCNQPLELRGALVRFPRENRQAATNKEASARRDRMVEPQVNVAADFREPARLLP